MLQEFDIDLVLTEVFSLKEKSSLLFRLKPNLTHLEYKYY